MVLTTVTKSDMMLGKSARDALSNLQVLRKFLFGYLLEGRNRVFICKAVHLGILLIKRSQLARFVHCLKQSQCACHSQEHSANAAFCPLSQNCLLVGRPYLSSHSLLLKN